MPERDTATATLLPAGAHRGTRRDPRRVRLRFAACEVSPLEAPRAPLHARAYPGGAGGDGVGATRRLRRD